MRIARGPRQLSQWTGEDGSMLVGPSWTFVFFCFGGDFETFFSFFSSPVMFLFVDFVGDFAGDLPNNRWEACWNVNTGGYPLKYEGA